ncbi:MAG: hypothetical protein AB1938_32765, partial [Myxococcota bacterium]
GGGAGGGVGGGFGGGFGGGGGTCAGCMTASGVCILPPNNETDVFCGPPGGMCTSCDPGRGERCLNGRCISGFGGGAGGGFGGGAGGGGFACTGCFTPSGLCIQPPNNNTSSFCGAAGTICDSCDVALGEQCISFRCQGGVVGGGPGGGVGGGFGGGVGGGFIGGGPGGGAGGGFGGGGGSMACSPGTCRGCCSGNVCVPFTSQTNFLCGSFGQACQACLGGSQCFNGACVFIADAGIVDAGMGPQVGQPCTSDAQCRPPNSGFCIPESVFGQPTGWPGGACTRTCGGSTNACPPASTCVNFDSTGQPLCIATCPSPRQGQSTCRSSYVCEFNPSAAGPGICIPRCNSPGFTCWQNTVCDFTSGYCVLVGP